MQKVANRALRRIVETFIPRVKSTHSNSTIHGYDLARDTVDNMLRGNRSGLGADKMPPSMRYADLSVPMYKRHGYRSVEDLRDAYRLNKLKLIDEAAATTPQQPTSRWKNLWNRFSGWFEPSPKPKGAPTYDRRELYKRVKWRGDNFKATANMSNRSNYAGAIRDYANRRISNTPSVNRFKDLQRRLSKLKNIVYGQRGVGVTADFKHSRYKLNPNTTMWRRLEMFGDILKSDNLTPAERSNLARAFSHFGVGPGTAGGLPLVHVFKSDRPFISIDHHPDDLGAYGDASAKLVDNILDHTPQDQWTRTALQPKVNALSENNSLRKIHTGEDYSEDLHNELATKMVANERAPYYEFTSRIGDQSFPQHVESLVVDSPDSRKTLKALGLQDALNRDTVPVSSVQRRADNYLYKGDQYPTHMYQDIVADTKHPLIQAYENTIDEWNKYPQQSLYKQHPSMGYNLDEGRQLLAPEEWRAGRNIVHSIVPTTAPYRHKYDDGEAQWFAPGVGTSFGYGTKGTIKLTPDHPMIPLTRDELRRISEGRPEVSLNAILDKLSPDEQSKFLRAITGSGPEHSARLRDALNKILDQIDTQKGIINNDTPDAVFAAADDSAGGYGSDLYFKLVADHF